MTRGYLFVERRVLRVGPLYVEHDYLVVFVVHRAAEVFHCEARPLLVDRSRPELSPLLGRQVFLSQQSELGHVLQKLSVETLRADAQAEAVSRLEHHHTREFNHLERSRGPGLEPQQANERRFAVD